MVSFTHEQTTFLAEAIGRSVRNGNMTNGMLVPALGTLLVELTILDDKFDGVQFIMTGLDAAGVGGPVNPDIVDLMRRELDTTVARVRAERAKGE